MYEEPIATVYDENLAALAVKDVNDAQREAITAPMDANVRIVAGAGTGKTLALTRRIVWLIAHGVVPSRILSVTFTNKAAAEMKSRLMGMLGEPRVKIIRAMTLHSLAWRIVSTYYVELGFSERPIPMDENESVRSIRRMWLNHPRSRSARIQAKIEKLEAKLDELNKQGKADSDEAGELCVRIESGSNLASEARKADREMASHALKVIQLLCTQGYWPASAISVTDLVMFLSSKSLELFGPVKTEAGLDFRQSELLIEICSAWEKYKHDNNLVDFSDMVLLAKHLFYSFPDILKVWRHKFDHILVDEFQDVNNEQFILLRLLTSGGSTSKLCLVGDQDQGIYGWRGANPDLMGKPMDRYYNPVTIKLVNNYRSKPEIIMASNELISLNKRRIPKVLRSVKEDGGQIIAVQCHDDAQQVDLLVENVGREIKYGIPPSEIAVIARRNNDLKAYANALLIAGIPHRVVGASKFFDSPWIKEALAWAMLVLRPSDESAFRLAVTAPAMGLGKQAIAELTSGAEQKVSFTSRLDGACETHKPGKVFRAVRERVKACEDAYCNDGVLGLFQFIISGTTPRSGSLIDWNAGRKTRGGKAVSGLKTLLDITERLVVEIKDEGPTVDENGKPIEQLDEFFSKIRLQAGDISVGTEDWLNHDSVDGPAVSLMTIHRSKGLEFESVHLVQCEDNGESGETLLSFNPGDPGASTVGRAKMICGGTEEARRVAYVAITRSKRLMRMYMARERVVYGKSVSCHWASFVTEMPSLADNFFVV